MKIRFSRQNDWSTRPPALQNSVTNRNDSHTCGGTSNTGKVEYTSWVFSLNFVDIWPVVILIPPDSASELFFRSAKPSTLKVHDFVLKHDCIAAHHGIIVNWEVPGDVEAKNRFQTTASKWVQLDFTNHLRRIDYLIFMTSMATFHWLPVPVQQRRMFASAASSWLMTFPSHGVSGGHPYCSS